ncbi:hypothetical protein [Asanoa sp. NPDC050611]|uniref:hypothetical protein n=1 Tax=Asanoa sp. NPDC050611 TaxID=3157098 RepID=UPI0033D54CFD
MSLISVDRPPENVAAPPNRGRRRLAALCLGLTTVGLVLGFAAAKLSADPHTARTEIITGTVTWSNEQTRLIAFERDGVTRGPDDSDTIYSVITYGWQDAGGTVHADDTYPSCLAGTPGEPVSMDRHRVEIKAIHRDTGGEQQEHIAVAVRCLD